MAKIIRNSLPILGTQVSATTFSQVLNLCGYWINCNEPHYICVAAAHLIMECHDNPQLRIGVNKGLVVPDGQRLVWYLTLSGKPSERIYGPNLTIKLCTLAEQKRWPIFLLGGAKGQGPVLVKHLQRLFPKLLIAGYVETPIRPIPTATNMNIIKKINQSGAKIVFVGLGCPLQEQWMMDNRTAVIAPVLVGVGAAFDFISGKVPQAPPWMQRTGLEWLFRLVQDPRRLWKRYSITNARFLILIFIQKIKHIFHSDISLK